MVGKGRKAEGETENNDRMNAWKNRPQSIGVLWHILRREPCFSRPGVARFSKRSSRDVHKVTLISLGSVLARGSVKCKETPRVAFPLP